MPLPDIKVPKTPWEKRDELFPDGFRSRADDDPHYDTKKQEQYCEKLKRLVTWSPPYDARFPQQRKQMMCFRYYVDFFRCRELLGEDYEGCKFFKNVYTTVCHQLITDKWDELREEDRFPYRFDR